MAKPITALLFDFDGTLLDTNELIIQTFEHVLNRHFPGKFERKEIITFIGPTLRETFSGIDPERVDELIHEYRTWNIANHDRLVTGYDGVSETLQALKELGCKLAIVSTKRNDTLLKGLKLMDAEKYFDAIIGLDDVSKPKPDAEPILVALERLGVSKDDAIMIGDNFHDIEGGKNAGVRTAGVAWSLKGEAFLQTFQPDYMLQHMSDLLTIVKGDGK